jgi:hypothetical protein
MRSKTIQGRMGIIFYQKQYKYQHPSKTKMHEWRWHGFASTHPQRKPAPKAALFSRFTETLASLSVSRSTAAAKASKSAPLTGNIPEAHQLWLQE